MNREKKRMNASSLKQARSGKFLKYDWNPTVLIQATILWQKLESLCFPSLPFIFQGAKPEQVRVSFLCFLLLWVQNIFLKLLIHTLSKVISVALCSEKSKGGKDEDPKETCFCKATLFRKPTEIISICLHKLFVHRGSQFGSQYF